MLYPENEFITIIYTDVPTSKLIFKKELIHHAKNHEVRSLNTSMLLVNMTKMAKMTTYNSDKMLRTTRKKLSNAYFYAKNKLSPICKTNSSHLVKNN